MLHDLYSEATLDRNDQENLELKEAIRKLNTEKRDCTHFAASFRTLGKDLSVYHGRRRLP